jgi:hypothetical protein
MVESSHEVAMTKVKDSGRHVKRTGAERARALKAKNKEIARLEKISSQYAPGLLDGLTNRGVDVKALQAEFKAIATREKDAAVRSRRQDRLQAKLESALRAATASLGIASAIADKTTKALHPPDDVRVVRHGRFGVGYVRALRSRTRRRTSPAKKTR